MLDYVPSGNGLPSATAELVTAWKKTSWLCFAATVGAYYAFFERGKLEQRSNIDKTMQTTLEKPEEKEEQEQKQQPAIRLIKQGDQSKKDQTVQAPSANSRTPNFCSR